MSVTYYTIFFKIKRGGDYKGENPVKVLPRMRVTEFCVSVNVPTEFSAINHEILQKTSQVVCL